MPSWVTGISAGMSLLSGKKGSDEASRSRSLQGRQLAIEAERDKFNRSQVETQNEYSLEDREDILRRRKRERGLFDPIQESIASLAQEGPDYEGAAARSDADVAQTFGVARGSEERRQRSYGVNPYSGRDSEGSRRGFNQEALAKVSGRQRSRVAEDDKDWSRRIAAMGMGNMRNVTPTTQLQQLGVSGASGVVGQMAADSGANAAGAFQLAGKLGADALSAYSARPKTQPGVNTGGTFTGNTGGDVDYFDF